MDMLFKVLKKPSQEESFGYTLENQEFASSGPKSSPFEEVKQLQNFNNQMSQIEFGNQQIDQDSIDQIKKQHKLLSGRRQTMQKKRNSGSDLSENTVFNGPTLNNKDSDKKQSKLSIQSKYDKPIISRFNSVPSNSNQTRNISNQLKKSKGSMLKQMTLTIQSLKKSKKDLFSYVKTQQTEFFKLKIRLIRFFQQKISAFLKQRQRKENQNSGNLAQNKKGVENISRKISNAQQDHNLLIDQLKVKLQEKQQEMQELIKQNESLQQHIFDIEQKIVGVDLQVQQKLEARKKQIEQKILKSPNLQTLQVITEQNQALGQRLKNYEKVITEYKEKQEQLSYKQQNLQKMQKDIIQGFQNLQQHQTKLLKRQSQLSSTQKNLNNKLNSLKIQIKQKQIQLSQWQNQIQKIIKRQKIMQSVENQLNLLNSQSIRSPRTPQLKNIQNFGIHIPLADSNKFNDQTELLNSIKTQRKVRYSEGLFDTFSKLDRQSRQDHANDFDHNYNTTNDQTIYDPKKHQQYEKFDYKQKVYQQKQQNNEQTFSNNHYPPLKSVQARNPFYQSKVSSRPIQFYQPTNNNSFRYQPQYKPPSSSSNLTKSNMKEYIYQHQKSKQELIRKPIVPTKNYGHNLSNLNNSHSHSHSQSFGNLKYQHVLNKSSSKDNNVKLTSLGSKLQELKAEIKHEIDSIN